MSTSYHHQGGVINGSSQTEKQNKLEHKFSYQKSPLMCNHQNEHYNSSIQIQQSHFQNQFLNQEVLDQSEVLEEYKKMLPPTSVTHKFIPDNIEGVVEWPPQVLIGKLKYAKNKNLAQLCKTAFA